MKELNLKFVNIVLLFYIVISFYSCQEVQMGIALIIVIPILLGLSFLIGAMVLTVLIPSKENNDGKKKKQSKSEEIFISIIAILISLL